MKILQVIEPGLDGVFRHVEGLTHFLIEQGKEVSLAYSDKRGSDRLTALVDKVKNAGGTALNLKVSNFPQIGDVFALAALGKLITKLRPDVAHAHSSKAGALIRGISRFFPDLPVFYTPNAYFGMGGRGGFTEALFNFVERNLGNQGITINVSGDEARFAREKLGIDPKRQVVIPNAVDTQAFHPGNHQDRLTWRKKNGIPDNSILLGTLGRMSYQKDPLTMYHAFAMAAERHPQLCLAQVGTGELRQQVESFVKEKRLSNRVYLLDYMPDPSTFYQSIDGFILTSRYEGLSFAVIEALATGLPLILSDVPGNRDFLQMNLSHIWSATAGDPDSFAKAIGKWIQILSQDTSSNHRETAESDFSFSSCYGRILALYEDFEPKTSSAVAERL